MKKSENEKRLAAMEPEDAKAFLEAHADSVEEGTIFREYTPEEMHDLKTLAAEKGIVIGDLEEDFKAVRKEWKKKIDDEKGVFKKALRGIRQRGEKTEGVMYNIADQDNGVMETYAEDGRFLGSRRLRQGERQITIMNKAANGD